MTDNIFEGARRIVRITAVLWVLICFVFFPYERTIDLSYSVAAFDYAPIRMPDNECAPKDSEEHRYLTTAKGTKVHLSLCFTSYLSKDRSNWVIPYGEDDTGENYWLGAEFSPEVISYKARRISQFILLKEYEGSADIEWWPGYLKTLWDRVPYAAGGVCSLFFLAGVIGWIVRGFLGIPVGQDRRVDKGMEP